MANIKSAEKRHRQALKRRDRNRAATSRLRNTIKQLRGAIEEGDASQAKELLPTTLGLVDHTAKKGVIHRNAAARTKSRLTKAVNALG